jgi:hypothetical protein
MDGHDGRLMARRVGFRSPCTIARCTTDMSEALAQTKHIMDMLDALAYIGNTINHGSMH